VGVVVGVDGAGRTFRLRRLAGASPAWWAAGDLAAGLARARDEGALVIVDDAHRLDAAALTSLAAAARDGVPMLISRRPTIDSAELAALDEAAAAGGVEVATPLAQDEVAVMVATATGRTVSPETAAAVHEASAGMAAVAAALADALAASLGEPAGGAPGGPVGPGSRGGMTPVGPGSRGGMAPVGRPGGGPGGPGQGSRGGMPPVGQPRGGSAGQGSRGGIAPAGQPGAGGPSGGGQGSRGGMAPVGQPGAGGPPAAGGARRGPEAGAGQGSRGGLSPIGQQPGGRGGAGPGSRGGLAPVGTGGAGPGSRGGMTPVGQAGQVSPRVVAVLGAPAPSLVARVQRRFAVLGAEVGAVARVLALQLELGDDVLAGAADTSASTLPRALRTLRDEGLLVPGEERMIPAVALAVLGELSAAERRRLHDSVGRALVAAGADPVVAATQLRAARVRTPSVAAIYTRAGEATRFADPAAALAWFDDADEAGADPADTAPGRAEAGALLGLGVDVDPQSGDRRLARLAGAAAAQDGRTERAADTLLAADPVLAVPVLVGVGRLDMARAAAKGDRLAEAALAAAEDPDAAVPLLIEAAEAAERALPTAVLPDTPHALGAIVAVACGDVAAAEHLLERTNPDAAGEHTSADTAASPPATGAADSAGPVSRAPFGGPAAAVRHRLLLAWVRMRAGRYDTALAELARPEGELPGRERLLRAAIAAGIARRRGDIAGLRAIWGGVEPVLARRVVDLWQLEAAEELLVAAARLQQQRRVEPVLALLERTVDGLGRPPAWAAALGWLRVQVAVAAGDKDEVAAQAARMPAEAGPKGEAQRAGAHVWAGLLAGTVVPADTILAVTDALAAVQLPWEASRLAGQAAIHTADPSTARRLLERARELSEPDSTAADAQPAAKVGRAASLSERELAVAKLVLAGSTHREIGAQLYIAPKTVEHHVARIRSKLGAGSRAELLAVLREIVSDPG
jgi:DNA-binding CsgD family transcriptional regulator